MTGHIPYLDTARLGRSGALDYAVGAILIVLVWLAVQTLFQAGLFFDPDLRALITEQVLEQASGDTAPAPAALHTQLLVIGGLLSPFSYLFYRASKTERFRKILFVLTWALVAMTAIGLALFAVSASTAGIDAGGETAELTRLFTQALGRSPLLYAIVLLSFVGGILGGWLVVRAIHGRTLQSLITAASRIRWSRMFWTCMLTLGVWAALQAIMVAAGLSSVEANPRASQMLPFVIATILFIPIQCAAEEVIFRGYLNQAMARFIPSVLVVIAISSVLFGAMHLANPEIATAVEQGTFWMTFSFYILIGLTLSILVLIDNGLESAIGVHTANNAFVAIFVNMENSALPVPGLYLASGEASSGAVIAYLLSMAVVIGVVWMTRKPLHQADTVLIQGTSKTAEAETLEDVFGT